ncbi:MAG: NAD(P)/FAD-dependent oxidoreductase [Archaeoglobus sp.]|uniref:FAD-dependent oxidoreductase n=1 Tax=Archaeoglobus sp. TaxID=1872626 RepID=UPI001D6FDE9A|nr:FAD/NAD(P)-binding oxidoreductase [Archaeoglobus sp.]MBO8180224.1 NAD(P)/FAD-dependent oxidoreductase [Archaeoglobus sp.]
MASIDYVVIGAGYAGLMCAEALMDKGFRALVFDMRSSGGEIVVFSKLEEFRSKYEKYIEKVEEIKEDIPVDVGTVIKSKPVIINSGNGLKRYEARRVILATGAADAAPVKLNVLSKKVKGIYTLDNALREISENHKIGEKVLLAAKDDVVVKLAESQLSELGYEVEIGELTGDIQVTGKERVEGVEISGVRYNCDTLIVYGGRNPFNPLKLRGTPVGNVVTCTYDYSKVEENVKNFIAKI